MTRSVPALGLAWLLVACGGGPGASGTGRETTAAREPDPCPTEGEVRLGRICWNPAGSRWHITAAAPGGEHAFDVELLAAYRLRATDHPAADPATDEWYVDGNTLRLFLSNRFVEYRAPMTNGTVMVGEAINVRGETWSWRGDRVPSGGDCRAEEARVGEVCFALAGTRWTLHDPTGDRVVHFAPGGSVLVDDREPEEGDRWSQRGAELRFTLHGREHVATVQDAERLAGTGWTADRVRLYPPPMR